MTQSYTMQNMFMSEYFSEAFFAYGKENIDQSLITNVPFTEAKFGILNLQAVKAADPTVGFDFVFTIDCSGSMTDLCSDKRSKMQHIIHTMKNIIWFFNDHPHINVFVTIFAFDNEIFNIVDRTHISKENISEIIEKIDTIRPRNSTDIELALKNATKYIASLKDTTTADGLVTNREIVHIFMTDGDATSGERNPEKLRLLIDNNVTNSFIGFGTSHDYKLLDEISIGINSNYYFIDQLESSGLVYGEILHNALYTILKNVVINCENSLVYDYKTNSWKNQLSIGNIFGESNKIYHIVSDSPFESNVYITFSGLEDSAFAIGHKIDDEINLDKYLFRQRTQQILYEVKNFKNNIHRPFTYGLSESEDMESDKKYSEELEEYTKNKKEYIMKMKRFIEEIKQYMIEHNLENDKFLKNLSDDIYICYKTFGTVYQNMFSTARQTSQGTQRQYTATSIPEDSFMDVTQPLFRFNKMTLIAGQTNSPMLTRAMNRNNLYCNDDDDSHDSDVTIQNKLSLQLPEELEYNLSQFEDTPYITPAALKIMRSVSNGIKTKDDNTKYNLDEEESQAI